MRRVPVLASLILILSAGSALAVEPARADARQLMRIVERALEDTVGAARAAGVDPEVARYRPFWGALDRMGGAVEEVGTALRARDERFFQALERGSRALGELRVTWARSGVGDPRVNEAIRIVSSSYRLLRRSYGGEQLRYRQRGGLSGQEREQFFKIQAAQRRFADRLAALRRRTRDQAAAAELERLIAEARRIAEARASLEAYLNALMASDEMRGEWEGNRRYSERTEREDRAEWQEAQEAVEDLAVEAEVGHVFVVNTGRPSGWGHLDQETEVTEVPSVEVFEVAAEEDEEEPEEALEEEVVEEVTWVEPAEEVSEEVEDAEAVEDVEVIEAVEGAEAVEPAEEEGVEEEAPAAVEEILEEEIEEAESAEPPPMG
jgi:hypothetical protein